MASAVIALDWSITAQEEVEDGAQDAQLDELWSASLHPNRQVAAVRAELEAELEQARNTLRLQEDQDVEDLYSQETLDRAITFLKGHIEWLWKHHGVRAAIPTVGAGPDGSVDLYWKRQASELLVNIPAAERPITYYGQECGKGTCDPGKVSKHIAAWLMI